VESLIDDLHLDPNFRHLDEQVVAAAVKDGVDQFVIEELLKLDGVARIVDDLSSSGVILCCGFPSFC
jgi:hypothetical protein